MKKLTALLLTVLMILSTAVFTVSAQEDITENPMIFNMNKNTTDYSEAYGTATDTLTSMQKDCKLHYTVHTEQEALYKLSLLCSAPTEGSGITVRVNGTTNTITNAPREYTGGHDKTAWNVLGDITLKAGVNKITFMAVGSAATCLQFKLEKLQDIFYIDVKDQAQFPTADTDYHTPADITSSSNKGWQTDSSLKLSYFRMQSKSGSSDLPWIEKTINVKEAGWYGVSAECTATNTVSVLQVSVDSELQCSKHIAKTSWNVYTPQHIGNVYLKAGNNTVRFTGISTSGYRFYSVTLSEAVDEIVGGSWSQPINAYSIFSKTGFTSADLTATHVIHRYNNNFSVVVYTEKAVTYAMTATCGTASESANNHLSVTVNGNKQIDKKAIGSTGGYTTFQSFSLGNITLNRGRNEISFGTYGNIGVSNIALALADSFQNGEFHAWVREGYVPEYYFGEAENAGWTTVSSSKCATIYKNAYMVFDVYTAEERVVNLTLDAAGKGDVSASLYVNNEAVLSEEDFGVPGNDYATFNTLKSNQIITIPQGYSTIKYVHNGGATNLRELNFKEASDGAYILDFALENEDGVRMVYSARDGLEAFASVTIRKLGVADDNYRLIVAQYKGKELIGVNDAITVDVSTLANGETKTVRSPLALQGKGDMVKAFLLDVTTYAPLTKAEAFASIDIFPENVLDTVVNSQLATETLNNEGVNYTEYGTHDASYDIDAIFYDGYNNTKVFAYVGIPKTASIDNKVPAMVLVHGGLGKAQKSWVQKWNDLGIAAIAMDLYGGGPETDASTPNGQKQHPYAGMLPWDNTAFLAEFENAGMYQNVISVINAHNLLRQNEKIDNSKIGITGISWGGVTTTTVIGVDDRFSFAVPVYGCGYLDECKTYFADFFKRSDCSIMWDPANFAAKATIPVLYVNGDTDPHFSLNSTSNSACVTKNAAISIRHHLGHTQAIGDSIEQVYRYAQSMFAGNSNPYIKITNSSVENGTMTANYTIPSGLAIEDVTMYYITTGNLSYDEDKKIAWQTVKEYTNENGTISMAVPEEATFCYVSITDNNEDIISTKFMQVK